MHPETQKHWQACADILRPYADKGEIRYPSDGAIASVLHCASRLLLALDESEPLDRRVANLALAHARLGEVPMGQCPCALLDAVNHARGRVCDAVNACVAVSALRAKKGSRS